MMNNNKGYIPVSNRNITKKLFFKDILLIEKEYHDIVFATINGTISVRKGLIDIGSYVRDRKDFYECHSYLIINMRNVLSMEQGQIFFANGEKRKLGKRNFSKAKTAFAEYLMSGKENSD